MANSPLRILIAGSSHARNMEAAVKEAFETVSCRVVSVDTICLPGGRVKLLTKRLREAPLKQYDAIFCIIGANDFFTKAGLPLSLPGGVAKEIRELHTQLKSRSQVLIAQIIPRVEVTAKLPKVAFKTTRKAAATNGMMSDITVPCPQLWMSGRRANRIFFTSDAVHLNMDGRRVLADSLVKKVVIPVPVPASKTFPAHLIAASRTLCRLLRHDSSLCNQDGYVSIQKLVKLNALCRISVADIHRIAACDVKGRFHIEGDFICANQGHSHDNNPTYTPLNTDTYHTAFHGTYLTNLPSIRKQGIKHMGRKFVHMAPGIKGVRSGMRHDCQVIIHVDTQLVTKCGIRLYMSNNDVILSPSTIPPSCIRKFVIVPKCLK